MIFLKLRNIVLLFVTCLLSNTDASPIRSSAKVSSIASGRKLIHIQQRFTREYANQDEDTTDDNTTDHLASTIEPQLSAHGDLPVQEEGILDDTNHTMNYVPQAATEPASTPVATSAPEAVLFYAPLPVEPLKDLPATHYGRPAESYSTAGHSKTKTSNRAYGSSATKLRQLGFPPISNTRENLGHQVNWAAKIGRSHESFHDFLSV